MTKGDSAKVKQSMTCDWITADDISEEKCAAESIEDLTTHESLKAIFSHRCNFKLQEVAMKMAQKIMAKEPPIKAWNEV